MANTITVELDLDTLKAKKALDTTEKGAKKSGERAGEKFGKGFSSSLPGLVKVASGVAGVLAGIAGALTFKGSIEAAQVQEDAINRLNAALTTSGDFSEQASKEFQELASEIQSVTKFGDELILNQIALSKSFGATNDQAKQIAQTSADLAEAFGTDLESATRNVSKTLGGYAGELGEVIPALKDLTKEQLQAGEGIKLISEQFGGTAAQRVKTFSGSITSLSNTFGDLLEEIGFVFTKSPALIKIIKFVGASFESLGNSIKSFRTDSDIFGNAIISAANFGKAVIDNVIRPFEIVFNVVTRVGEEIRKVFVKIANSVISVFKTIVEKAEPVLSFLGKKIEGTFELMKEKADDLTSAGGLFEGVLDDTSFSDSLDSSLGKLIEFTETAEPIMQQFRESSRSAVAVVKNEVETTATSLIGVFDSLKVSFSSTTEQLKEQSKKITGIVKGTLVKGISGGIQSIINSIANGENAFENLGKFFLQTIGQMAIQMGETLILTGIGIESLKSLGGTAAIAAGAGLIALGAIISSIAGGGGSGAASGGGGSSSTATGGGALATSDSRDLTQASAIEDRQVASNITIEVQGSLVQQEELGRLINEVQNDEREKNGSIQTSVRVA